MKNILFNRQHIRDYLLYGTAAGLLFSITTFIFLYSADYNNAYLVFLGSGLFPFPILAYLYKLSKRRGDYRSTMQMSLAGHLAVLLGIVVSVLLSLVLCFIFIPGFLSGDDRRFLADAPQAYQLRTSGTILYIFMAATLENFGAGGFAALLGPYVFKRNQTKDKPAAGTEFVGEQT